MQLTATQQTALSHLAAGKSVAETAQLCGIHRNTITNWRREIPAFSSQLNEAIRERSLLLQELIPDAIEILRTTLHNEEASPSLRLRAALAVLKMSSVPTPAPEAQPEPQPLPTKLNEALAAKIQEVQAQHQEIQEKMHKFAQRAVPQPVRRPAEPGRNSQCPCGSGVKYKRCCANIKQTATAA